MNTLTRTSLRNFWLLALAVLAICTLVSFKYAKDARLSIDESRLQLDAAYRELDNAKRLSASLTELDRQTINEKTATRLEILRHLGLERTDYDVDINSRQQQQVGPTSLYLRDVDITAELPYALALELTDRLHNAGRIVLSHLTMDIGTQPDHVKIKLEGTLYGLEKKQTMEEAPAVPAAQTSPTTVTSPTVLAPTVVAVSSATNPQSHQVTK